MPVTATVVAVGVAMTTCNAIGTWPRLVGALGLTGPKARCSSREADKVPARRFRCAGQAGRNTIAPAGISDSRNRGWSAMRRQLL